MAIEKDAIVRQGDPYVIWISNDWTDVSDTKKSGLREVKAIDVVYGDGQRATLVLNEQGQPFTHQALRSLSPDKTQTDLYQAEQTSQKPPGGQSLARQPDGTINEWNPAANGGKGGYTIPRPDLSPATTGKPAGSITRPEGTPTGRRDASGALVLDASGQPERDNSQPIMVTRAPDGRIVSADPMTADERNRWEKEKNAAAGLGSKTDSELAAAASTTPVPTANPADPTRMRVPDGKGGWQDAGPNAAGVQAAQTANAPTVTQTNTTRGGKPFVIQISTPKPTAAAPNPTPTTQIIDVSTGQVVPTLPDEPGATKRTQVQLGGKNYVHVETTDANKNTEDHYELPGQPGVVVQIPETAGNSANAPLMPHIVVGAASETLTNIHNALQRDPTLTDAQKEKYFQQAVQTANASVADFNAQYNLAGKKLDYLESTTSTALTFALSLIKGHGGGAAGAKAFTALMGLQMLNLRASGILDIKTGKAGPPPPVITPADLTDPSKLDDKSKEVKDHLEAATAAAPAAAQAETDRQQQAAAAAPAAVPPATATGARDSSDTVTIRNAKGVEIQTPRYMVGEGPGKYSADPSKGGWTIVADPKAVPATAPISPAAPTAAPAPSSVAAPSSAPAAPAPAPDYPVLAVPPAPAPAAAVPPDYGAPGMSALPAPVAPNDVTPENVQPDPVSPPSEQPAAAPADEMVTFRNRFTGALTTIPRSQVVGGFLNRLVFEEIPSGGSTPRQPTPGLHFPQTVPSPIPVDVPYPTSAGAESKILGGEYPVLARYQQPAQSGYGDLYSRAASTPPWRMSSSDYEQMKAAGVPEEVFWSVPGTAA